MCMHVLRWNAPQNFEVFSNFCKRQNRPLTASSFQPNIAFPNNNCSTAFPNRFWTDEVDRAGKCWDCLTISNPLKVMNNNIKTAVKLSK